MRKILGAVTLVVFAGMVLVGCGDKRVSRTDKMPWANGKYAQILQNTGDQPVMIFFHTEW